MSTGLICLRKIYDDNLILLDNHFSDKTANFKRIGYAKFFSDYILLDKKQDHNMKVQLLKDKKDHVLKVRYRIIKMGH